MTVPVIAICGIATDEASWQGMPVDAVLLPRGATIAAMADTMLPGLPTRFALAGHSMGGYVAQEIAARLPDRLAGLALISSSAMPDSAEQQAGRDAVIARAKDDYAGVTEGLARAMLSKSSRADPDIFALIHAMLIRCGGATFAEQQMAVRERIDYRPMLGAIGVPTCIIAGSEDRIIPSLRSEELAESISGATLTLIEQCGHVPQCEAPALTAAALSAWRTRLGD
ncbi:MAG: alpha/beta fold hydrolase [Blastomonas sp.]